MLFDGLFSPAAIGANWTENTSNRIPYLGEGLFPARKQAGLDLKWIKGSKGIPVSLMPSAFDAKATFRDRIGLEKIQTEMPFFREGFKIKEKDRQDILRIREQNDPLLNEALNKIFNDAGNLLEGALVVPERMIMQLLFAENGYPKIEIKANGVDYTYNYDPDGSWRMANYIALTSSATWDSTTTADPFADIQNAKDKIAAQGGIAAYIVMNSATFRLLRSIKAVKEQFLTVNGLAVGHLTDKQIKQVLADASELQGVVVYDKQYKDESGETHKFIPDDYVAVLPEGNLGNTWRGTTPEEADLMGSNKADVAIVNKGIAITQILDTHPVNLNTFASEIVLPSYERMNEVALIKVK